MAFALKLRKTDAATVQKAIERAAEILGLHALSQSLPRQLSGGQRQRVAMGRAIVRDPKVFLFDEPLSNLDAKLRVQMRKEIKELHQRLKTTTIFVTHDQVEAMTMADKIVVMNDGNVEQVGSPLNLYDNPQNLFVATFIGSPAMNLFSGVYRKRGNVFETATGERQKLLGKFLLDDGAQLIMGVRPEHLALNKKGLKATVSVVEPTGSETLVFMRHGDEELVAVFRERHDFSPGQTIGLSPDADRIHLFDPKTGGKIEVDE